VGHIKAACYQRDLRSSLGGDKKGCYGCGDLYHVKADCPHKDKVSINPGVLLEYLL
jgi:hypothetical protein